MKKEFFAALLLGAVILVGCNPKDDPQSDVTGIRVTPQSVVLNDNEQSIRLACTLTPEGATATVEWSSSDTTIATVSKTGYVEAAGYGECYIFAQVGELKDSCFVEVKSYLESILFNGAFLYDVDSTYAYSEELEKYIVDTIESSSGKTYYAYRALATLWLFSDGFYVSESGYLDGTEKGVIIEYQAPMWYATAYLNNSERGTVFSLGDWAILENAEEYDTHVSAPGSIDEAEFITQMKGFIEAYNANDESYANFLKAAGEAVKAPSLEVETYKTTESGSSGYYSSYIPDAIVNEGLFTVSNEDYTASSWMYSLSYAAITFSPLDGLWGLNVDEDAEGNLTLLDEDIHFEDAITSVYGSHSSNSMQMIPVKAPLASEDAALKARLEKQLKDNNIKVFRIKK